MTFNIFILDTDLILDGGADESEGRSQKRRRVDREKRFILIEQSRRDDEDKAMQQAEEQILTKNRNKELQRDRSRSNRQEKVRYGRALFDCDADDEEDLSFAAGDMLLLLEQEGEWWRARVLSGPLTPPLSDD